VVDLGHGQSRLVERDDGDPDQPAIALAESRNGAIMRPCDGVAAVQRRFEDRPRAEGGEHHLPREP
jgi:hypothetical protein